MRIPDVSPVSTFVPRTDTSVNNKSSFPDVLKGALQEVNTLQTQSDLASQQLITGDIEFHDAMIVAEKANLALELTMAIRTRLIESYQEIMRMQV